MSTAKCIGGNGEVKLTGPAIWTQRHCVQLQPASGVGSKADMNWQSIVTALQRTSNARSKTDGQGRTLEEAVVLDRKLESAVRGAVDFVFSGRGLDEDEWPA